MIICAIPIVPALDSVVAKLSDKHRAPDRSRRSLAEQRLGILGHELIKHLAQVHRLELLADVLRLAVRLAGIGTIGGEARRACSVPSARLTGWQPTLPNQMPEAGRIEDMEMVSPGKEIVSG